MDLNHRVHPEADAEYVDAVRYYQSVQWGLGADFDRAAASAVDDIAWNPEAWPPFPGWTASPVVRSRRIEVFPYRVIYLVRDGDLVLLAFAHESRRPGYWRHRV